MSIYSFSFISQLCIPFQLFVHFHNFSCIFTAPQGNSRRRLQVAILQPLRRYIAQPAGQLTDRPAGQLVSQLAGYFTAFHTFLQFFVYFTAFCIFLQLPEAIPESFYK